MTQHLGLPARTCLALLLSAVAWPQAGGAQERTVADGVYVAEQAERGRTGYAVFCAHCHADDLSGDNTGDAGAPPLRWDGFKDGSTALALFTKIQEAMPLDARGALASEQYLDILAYIFQENGFPAGEGELTDDDAVLAGIRIVRRGEPSR